MKGLTLHRLASSLHHCQHTYVKAKMTIVLDLLLLWTLYKNIRTFFNCQNKLFLYRFLVFIFFVKVLRLLRQIWKATSIKMLILQKINGEEIEAMKRLTLHRIASSLLVPSFTRRVCVGSVGAPHPP
jgi:hypothetical protein